MHRRRMLAGAGVATVVVLGLLSLFSTTVPRPGTAAGLAAVDSGTFWAMVSAFSESGGYFRSDNFVSNETTFQRVMPALIGHGSHGGAYLGVGPDQNFTYIVAVRPDIAFIIDIRRQNLLLHLLYKALVELSTDRAEFVSRLFSRPRPEGLGAMSTVEALFDAYATVSPDPGLRAENGHAVMHRLVAHHGFTLTPDDARTVEYVYDAFFAGGPDLSYSFPRQYAGYGGYAGYGWRRFPSYAELMTETDSQGGQQSYLATESHYQALRRLHLDNRIVPVVGDFAGDGALRAVGNYLRAKGLVVRVFYTSNVEQYLFRGDAWRRFFANVATLPIDERSTFVRAFFNTGYRYQSSHLRSATLLSPIDAVVAAVQDGRVRHYGDVIALSRDPSTDGR